MVVTILFEKSKEKRGRRVSSKPIQKKEKQNKRRGGASMFVDSSVTIRHPLPQDGKNTQPGPSVRPFLPLVPQDISAMEKLLYIRLYRCLVIISICLSLV